MRGSSSLLTGAEPVAADLVDLPGRRAEAARAGMRRAPGSYFLGLGVGTGVGAHFTRGLEHHAGTTVSTGAAYGGLLHLMPEIGFQYRDKLAFSLQSRHQYIRATGFDPTLSGRPPQAAHALFARAYYELGSTERMQWLGTATLGGGSGFRLKIAPVPVAGLPSSDTIKGGPVVAGPGGTLFVHLNDRMLLATEIRLLVGLHNIAAIAEGSIGLQYGF
jgi:hypothetical protein